MGVDETGRSSDAKVGARIRELRESRKPSSRRWLADALSDPEGPAFQIDPKSIERYEAGEREIPLQFVAAVARLYQESQDWLATGRGPVPLSIADKPSAESRQPSKTVSKRIERPQKRMPPTLVPVYIARPTAGFGGATEEGREGEWPIPDEEARAMGAPGKTLAAFRVKKDSMEPELRHGDLVFVALDREPQDGIAVLIKDGGKDGGLVVKRVQMLVGTKIKLISDNKKYDAEDYDLADGKVQFIGPVLRVWRTL